MKLGELTTATNDTTNANSMLTDMLRGSDQLLIKAQYDIDELAKRQAAVESALANLSSKAGMRFTSFTLSIMFSSK